LRDGRSVRAVNHAEPPPGAPTHRAHLQGGAGFPTLLQGEHTMQKTSRKKLQLNKETVRQLVSAFGTDTVLVVDTGEPTLCPTDGTKTCVIGR
jgi:hypothetical protein